jgi:hypothetical protein
MLRNAMGRDLIKLQENTTKEDEEHHLEKPYETANENKSSVNLSFQINRAGKGNPKEQLLILEAMRILLSQNCSFSFTCNN